MGNVVNRFFTKECSWFYYLTYRDVARLKKALEMEYDKVVTDMEDEYLYEEFLFDLVTEWWDGFKWHGASGFSGILYEDESGKNEWIEHVDVFVELLLRSKDESFSLRRNKIVEDSNDNEKRIGVILDIIADNLDYIFRIAYRTSNRVDDYGDYVDWEDYYFDWYRRKKDGAYLITLGTYWDVYHSWVIDGVEEIVDKSEEEQAEFIDTWILKIGKEVKGWIERKWKDDSRVSADIKRPNDYGL